jgi:hypothetical protein
MAGCRRAGVIANPQEENYASTASGFSHRRQARHAA